MALTAYSGRQPKTNKDGRPRKQRKGWGRFQSVLKERSVDFNLTLDVQNLKQEVQNLATLRDILSAQSLVRRTSPEGSLAQKANEYFRVFRMGAVLRETGRKRAMDDMDQRAFMHSIMDEDVDVGNGLKGPDVMMDQMITYSSFLRFIEMTGRVHNIVQTDGTASLFVKGSFRFQVLRSTIQMVFPHVMGNEWIVAQLVGKEVESAARSTFHFNAEGKCCKYDVDMDFVDAFMSVVKDPQVVDALLGRALIADNAMFGVIDEVSSEEEEKEPVLNVIEDVEASNDPRTHVARANATPVAARSGAQEFCQRIVEEYFSAFAHGYQSSEVSQQELLLHRFSTTSDVGTKVKARWETLSECFEVLDFQQKGATRFNGGHRSTCVVNVAARYILRISFHTIQTVFPHLLSESELLDILLGKVIVVPSQISLFVEKSTGRVSQIEEHMDFFATFAELLPTREDIAFVMSRALLSQDGVDLSRSGSSSRLNNQEIQLPRLSQPSETQSSSRTMSMADILG